MNDKIRQDINFLEYPLWVQNERTTVTTITWTDQAGYTFEAMKGLPSKVDMMFLYFLLLKCQNQNWNHELVISRYQILTGCGIVPSKKKYQRLEDSLQKWRYTGISFSGKFYDGEKYQSLSFGIINDWSLKEDDKKIRINLNKFWIEKIKQSKFFKYVSFNQMKTLRSPLALRLYEILVKTFYNRKTWEIDSLKLAAKIPMQENEMYFSVIKKKIIPATKRIREKTDLNVKVQVVKQGRGQGKFIFSKFAKQTSQQQNFLSPKEADTLPDIPAELLDMIPLPDRAGCMNLCQKIFADDGADGLRFYLEKTNNRKQNGKSSYSGYLKTISNLNLYADYLVTKKDLEDQVRAEQAKVQEELRKQQEEEVRLQEQRMPQKALRQLEQDHPEKYQQLYDQAARDLDINPDRLKRGDKLKIIFKIIEGQAEAERIAQEEQDEL